LEFGVFGFVICPQTFLVENPKSIRFGAQKVLDLRAFQISD
jgi:hypothetical protein